MAYVHRLINDDEKLIGIARLHWIYVLQGLSWFIGLAIAGLGLSWLMNRGMMALTNMGGNAYVPAPILGLSSGIMLFMLAAGAMIFLFYVVKVLATQIALTDRRVIQKKGLIFVNVHHIDLEEIRGENLDLGIFGRILGYGYLMLDCRFIGDIKLDAIERPERFLRALHDRRAHAQDALNLVVGKSGAVSPVNIQSAEDNDANKQQAPQQDQQPPQPEVQPPKPVEPEIQPPQPDNIPPLPNQPMPNQPPPMDEHRDASKDDGVVNQQSQSRHEKQSNEEKEAWESDGKMKAAMAQRIEKLKRELMEDLTVNQNGKDDMKAPESLHNLRTRGEDGPEWQPHSTSGQSLNKGKPEQERDHKTSGQGPQRSMSKEDIAKAVQDATPQIVQQVVREMTEQGLIKPPAPQNDNGVDNDLIHVFDEAAEKDNTPHDNRNSLEHSIH